MARDKTARVPLTQQEFETLERNTHHRDISRAEFIQDDDAMGMGLMGMGLMGMGLTGIGLSGMELSGMGTSSKIKPKERDAIVQSLRAGVVPRTGLQHIQVGRSREIEAMLADLDQITAEPVFDLLLANMVPVKLSF